MALLIIENKISKAGYHNNTAINQGEILSFEIGAGGTGGNGVGEPPTNTQGTTGGATTLSGDKLLNYFINDGESTLLFLAVENEARPNKAKIYEGVEALEYIKTNVPGVVKR